MSWPEAARNASARSWQRQHKGAIMPKYDLGKYHCYWGDSTVGVTNEALMEEHDFTWFTSAKGYSASNLQEIFEMQIGECVNLSEITQQHVVVCVRRHTLPLP